MGNAIMNASFETVNDIPDYSQPKPKPITTIGAMPNFGMPSGGKPAYVPQWRQDLEKELNKEAKDKAAAKTTKKKRCIPCMIGWTVLVIIVLIIIYKRFVA